jgi:hypothetical protein
VPAHVRSYGRMFDTSLVELARGCRRTTLVGADDCPICDSKSCLIRDICRSSLPWCVDAIAPGVLTVEHVRRDCYRCLDSYGAFDAFDTDVRCIGVLLSCLPTILDLHLSSCSLESKSFSYPSAISLLPISQGFPIFM